jgi:hypothetical protein
MFPSDYLGSPLDIQSLDSTTLPDRHQAALATVFAAIVGDAACPPPPAITHPSQAPSPSAVDNSLHLSQHESCILMFLFSALFLQLPSSVPRCGAAPGGTKSAADHVSHRLAAWRSSNPADLRQLFAHAGLCHDASGTPASPGPPSESPNASSGPALDRVDVQWTLGHRAGPNHHDDQADHTLANRNVAQTGHGSRAHTPGNLSASAPASKEEADKRLYRRVHHLIRKDRCGKALALLARLPFLDPAQPECRERVHALHPRADPERAAGATHADTADRLLASTPQADLPVAVSAAAICKAITLSPCESSPGPDGMRFEHLKSLLNLSKRSEAPLANAGTAALDALTAFVNTAANGQLPPEFRKPFLAARLFLLEKKPGEPTPRPIAVRGACARLVARALLVGRDSRIRDALGHQQLGVSASCGAEGIALAMRQYLQLNKHVIAWDAANAFNTIDRHAVLQQVAALFPDLLRWTAFAYSAETPLFAVSPTMATSVLDPLAHVFRFSSAEGVQQGDPLASLLFCLALKPALDELTAVLRVAEPPPDEQALVPQTLALDGAGARNLCSEPFVISALMDDIDVAASPAAALICIECLPHILKKHCNLEINWRKSIVHPPLPSHPDARATFSRACDRGGGTPTETHDGLRCLGVPISARTLDEGFRPPVGSDNYVQAFLDSACASATAKMDQIVAYVQWSATAVSHSATLAASSSRRGRARRRRGAAHFHRRPHTPPQHVLDGVCLLLHCVLPRLTYLLRVAPPQLTDKATQVFDTSFLRAFSTITGVDPESFQPMQRPLTPDQALRALQLSLPWRHGGAAIRSLHALRARAYTAGCVDAERIAVTLTAGPSSAGSATLEKLPFASELGFSAALRDVLRQASIADAEAHERYSRLPPWKARLTPAPGLNAIENGIKENCITVLARDPYWSSDRLRLQHSITLALETAAFQRGLNPPIPVGTVRSAVVQSGCNRLAALAMKGVGAWMRTVPVDPALSLTDAEYKDSIRYTFALPRVPAFRVGKRCPRGPSCALRGRRASLAAAPLMPTSGSPSRPDASSLAAAGSVSQALPVSDSHGLHSETCTGGLWSDRHDRIQDLFRDMGRDAGLSARLARVADLAHPAPSLQKADLVFTGFEDTDFHSNAFPPFDTTRPLVVDFTCAVLLDGKGAETAGADVSFLWKDPHAELKRKDDEKVRKHGAAAEAHHSTFWPAAVTLDYGLGRSATLLYKLLAAAARRNGHTMWRWHRTWRPRFAAYRARQRFATISHVLGAPPSCVSDPTPALAPRRRAHATAPDLDTDVSRALVPPSTAGSLQSPQIWPGEDAPGPLLTHDFQGPAHSHSSALHPADSSAGVNTGTTAFAAPPPSDGLASAMVGPLGGGTFNPGAVTGVGSGLASSPAASSPLGGFAAASASGLGVVDSGAVTGSVLAPSPSRRGSGSLSSLLPSGPLPPPPPLPSFSPSPTSPSRLPLPLPNHSPTSLS